MEYLIIDPSTRKITIPKSEQLFGVYGEGNIERKYFKCPKIVGDNVDLSDCYIFVNYYTAKGLPGKYTVKDVNVDGENITFSWELKPHIFDANEDTSIYFAVEAKNKDKVGVFRTSPATGKTKETIDTDKEIEETHADVILDLISRVDTLEREPISEEQIEKSVKSYLEKNPIEETDPTVPAWAKEEEKPTYTAEEVGALPSTTVIPSKLSELTADDEHETVTKEEKQAWNAKSDFSGEYRDLRGKPELAEWALQREKPTYTAREVGALPDTTEIPKNLSDLQDDAEHRTVTDTEKQSWNDKSGTGLSDIAKKLLITILKNAVYTVNQKANIEALENALSTQNTPTDAWSIVQNLTYVTSTNTAFNVKKGESYTTTIVPNTNYMIDSVTVVMGGVDITNTAYNNGVITINSVTGNVIITAIAKKNSGALLPSDGLLANFDFRNKEMTSYNLSGWGNVYKCDDETGNYFTFGGSAKTASQGGIEQYVFRDVRKKDNESKSVDLGTDFTIAMYSTEVPNILNSAKKSNVSVAKIILAPRYINTSASEVIAGQTELGISRDKYMSLIITVSASVIRDIAMKRLKGADCKTLMLEVLVEDTSAENHLAYVEEVMVKPQSYGGDTSGVNIPFKVSSDGKRTEGYVSATSLASGNPEFTAGTIPHSLSTGKEVL